MSDPIRDINKGHEDGADILRVSNVDGRNRTLAEQAWERIKLDTDDGLKGTDYSADRVSGSKSSSHREHRTNPDYELWVKASKQYAEAGDTLFRLTQKHAPRIADSVASRKAETENRKGEQVCAHCAAYGHEAPARSLTDCPQRNTAGAVVAHLPDAQLLCRWCQDIFGEVHRLPTESELHRHHKGRKVLLPEMEKRRAQLLTRTVEASEVVEVSTWRGQAS